MGAPRKTRCKYGHQLTPDHVHVWISAKGHAQRHCLVCRRAYDRERYRDKPERREAIKARVSARYYASMETRS